MSGLADLDILQALQTSVTAAVDQSDDPMFPVKYIGRTFDIPSDQRWIELIFIPNNREDFWGNEQNYAGLFRIILHWTNDDAGAYPPMRFLRSVIRYYSKSQMLGIVQLTSGPTLTGVLEEGQELLYPCSVRYACFSRS